MTTAHDSAVNDSDAAITAANEAAYRTDFTNTAATDTAGNPNRVQQLVTAAGTACANEANA